MIKINYTEEQIQAVWEKGTIVHPNDPNTFRQDICRAWIARKEYGNVDSDYGWEMDHIIPQSQGGSDSITNLRPLQWRNNRSRLDGNTNFCDITSSGTKNTPRR